MTRRQMSKVKKRILVREGDVEIPPSKSKKRKHTMTDMVLKWCETIGPR